MKARRDTMADKKRVLVRINDQEFTVVSKEEEPYVVELARYVDENISDIMTKNSKLSRNMAYILAAFNIADNFYKEREALEAFRLEAKEPMENCEKYGLELQEVKEKYEKLKSESDSIKDELIYSKREVEKLSKKASEQEQTIKIKSSEVVNSERIIKELQDKLFKEQMEVVKLKKELKGK
jgi:cell division protein ZapA